MYLWPIVAGMGVLCVRSTVGGFGCPSNRVSGASREQTFIDIVLN